MTMATLRSEEGDLHCGQRWLEQACEVDGRVLARAAGPVLDIGCGPGRHVRALAQLGLVALGIDVTPRAIEIARARGVDVLHRSVFDRVPASGRWRTALLLDGNLGIGGDPLLLLRRTSELLAPRGRILVECAPPGEKRGVERVCLDLHGDPGPWFDWTVVGADRIGALANDAGLLHTETWCDHGRWFSLLER